MPTTIIDKPIMWTIKQAAAELGLPEYFIRRLVWDHKVKYVNVNNKKYLINAKDLCAYLEHGDDIVNNNIEEDKK